MGRWQQWRSELNSSAIFSASQSSVPLWSCKYVLLKWISSRCLRAQYLFAWLQSCACFSYLFIIKLTLLLISKLNAFCIFATSTLLCVQLLAPSLDISHSHLFSSLSVTSGCENAPNSSLKNGILEPNLREKEASLLRDRFCPSMWTFSFPTVVRLKGKVSGGQYLPDSGIWGIFIGKYTLTDKKNFSSGSKIVLSWCH